MATATLNDFWSDQYHLYLPRVVDGPEIVRHENIKMDEPVTILRFGDTVGGLCRRPQPRYILLGSAAAAKKSLKNDRKMWDLGVFVEDASVTYSDFKISGALLLY